MILNGTPRGRASRQRRESADGADRAGGAARHRLLVAAVADPRLAEMAAARGNAAAVYDAAAGERARSERARISALLRRRGVQVVDAPPDRLPAALADTYLSLKAAGRL